MTELTDLHAEELIRRLWHKPTIDSYSQCGILVKNPTYFSAAYTDYYQRQWITMAGQDGLHVWFKTPHDLNEFISYMSASKSLAKEGLLSYLEANWGTSLKNEYGGHSLNLALSLLLMVKFGPMTGEVQPHTFLQWTSGCLKECLRRHFNADPILDTHDIRLSQNFNAWSLKTIGGIEIGFTDNLDDHLLLVERSKGMKVLIFHHVSFLECHTSSIFPDGFLTETLETLRLVFPESEFGKAGGHKARRRAWYENLRNVIGGNVIDLRLGSCGTLRVEHRRIERFRYWRDRLVVLKQAYDEATPRTLSQWRYDQRNQVVWWTFWIAVLVFGLAVVVGIIQCVLAGIQVTRP